MTKVQIATKSQMLNSSVIALLTISLTFARRIQMSPQYSATPKRMNLQIIQWFLSSFSIHSTAIQPQITILPQFLIIRVFRKYSLFLFNGDDSKQFKLQ